MSAKSAAERNLEARAALFKALGHPSRLLILNLLRAAPRHGQELAEILRLSPATVSHHLSALSEANLVHAEREQYYQVYGLDGDLFGKTLEQLVRLSQPGLDAEVQADAYRKKVLGNFMRQGRLTQIPAQRKKRSVILARLIEEFEPERDYPEAELNRILVDFHHDVETLRREFIAEGLMTRDRGVYRRA